MAAIGDEPISSEAPARATASAQVEAPVAVPAEEGDTCWIPLLLSKVNKEDEEEPSSKIDIIE